jgi:hypothetical protein
MEAGRVDGRANVDKRRQVDVAPSNLEEPFMPPTLPTAIQRFHALITGNWVTASLYTAAVLGIADLLGEGPRSVQDLAGTTQTDADALRRLMRALAAQGVFAEQEDGRFAQTELSAFLRCDAAPSLRSILLMYGSEVWWKPWGQILHSIRTGETAFSKVHGAELFEYMKREAPFAAIFNQAMTEGSTLRLLGLRDHRRCRRWTGLAAIGHPEGDPGSTRNTRRPAARRRDRARSRRGAWRRLPL